MLKAQKQSIRYTKFAVNDVCYCECFLMHQYKFDSSWFLSMYKKETALIVKFYKIKVAGFAINQKGIAIY